MDYWHGDTACRLRWLIALPAPLYGHVPSAPLAGRSHRCFLCRPYILREPAAACTQTGSLNAETTEKRRCEQQSSSFSAYILDWSCLRGHNQQSAAETLRRGCVDLAGQGAAWSAQTSPGHAAGALQRLQLNAVSETARYNVTATGGLTAKQTAGSRAFGGGAKARRKRMYSLSPAKTSAKVFVKVVRVAWETGLAPGHLQWTGPLVIRGCS